MVLGLQNIHGEMLRCIKYDLSHILVGRIDVE
jgi:hypothetical protein